MSRTIMEIPFHYPFEQEEQTVRRILSCNGFKEITLKSGEKVWKKGTGLLTAMQYVKTEYAADKVVLSAWVQVGIGALGGGEMDLEGMVCAIPKQMLKSILEGIRTSL